MKYEIIQTATGHSFGVYEGCDGAEAIGAMLEDAGCADDPDPGVRAVRVVECECGEVMGEKCSWTGPAAETVVVEWMPPQYRDSHTAAGNSGFYPANGAVRLRCERECAERILEGDGEWAAIVR